MSLPHTLATKPSDNFAHVLANELLALHPSTTDADKTAIYALVSQLCQSVDAGHTCLDISELCQQYGKLWLSHALCMQAGTLTLAPIVIDPPYASFARHYMAELQLAQNLYRIRHSPFVTPIEWQQLHLDVSLNDLQKQAIYCALEHNFCLISGGPGTGKTYTLARIVAALASIPTVRPLSVAMAAPTGKAALRMQQVLSEALAKVNVANLHIASAATVHTLLGMYAATGTPKYHNTNPLPFDVIVVDEASMLDLQMASKLCSAVASGSKLIWLGDANQLAAVEAGSVLADIAQAPSLTANHVHLTQSKRFAIDSGVGYWAHMVLSGNTQALSYPTAFSEVLWHSNWQTVLSQIVVPYKPFAEAINGKLSPKDLFNCLSQYRILCSTHYGAGGVHALNRLCAAALFERDINTTPYFNGAVLMLRQNQKHLQLANGDIAICLHSSYLRMTEIDCVQADGYYLVFENMRTYPVQLFEAQMLQSAFALTIHKSQGSEFHSVAIVLPAADAAEENTILSRQLLYTAITRSKNGLAIYADAQTLQHCITQNNQRRSLLAKRLSEIDERR